MKSVVTELAFLFVWISLLFGRVLLTGENRPKFCSLPKVTGPCRAAFTRWYYNTNSNKCEKFTYGGCNGNEGNNFKTKDECEGNCTTNTGRKGHPFQLVKLFAKKNSRVTEKTRLIRRELKPEQSQSNVSLNEEEKINPPSNLAGEKASKENDTGSQPQSPDVNIEETTGSLNKLRSGNNSKATETTSPSKNGSDVVNTAGPLSQSQGGSYAVTTTKTPSPSKNGSDAVNTSGPTSQSQGRSDVVTTTKTPSPSKTGSDAVNAPGTPEGGRNEGGDELPSNETNEDSDDELHRQGEIGGKAKGLPSQREGGSNEEEEDSEDRPNANHFQHSLKDSLAYPYEHTSSHFAAFFLTSIVMVFAAYVVYHNRQKIVAIVIEGRGDANGRRRGYRKLETNVEEAMPSLKSSNSTYVY